MGDQSKMQLGAEIVHGGFIGRSYVVVRQNMGTESEVSWIDRVHLRVMGSTRSNMHRATTSMIEQQNHADIFMSRHAKITYGMESGSLGEGRKKFRSHHNEKVHSATITSPHSSTHGRQSAAATPRRMTVTHSCSTFSTCKTMMTRTPNVSDLTKSWMDFFVLHGGITIRPRVIKLKTGRAGGTYGLNSESCSA